MWIVLTLIACMAAVAPAGAQNDSARNDKAKGKARNDAATGTISMQGLTLSGTQFGTPTGNPTLVPTDALETPLTEGASFRYSSIRCAAGPAPYNNVGLDFTPDYPGLADPASIRTVISGTVTKAKKSGARGKIRGTITSYLCQGGQETDQITVSFKAKYRPTSDTAIVLRGGQITTTGGLALTGKFQITDGTGRFEDIKGHGSLTAQLTCLPSTLTRNGATSCATLGAFSEAVFDMTGRYRDPTIPSS
jgi:hypothetical protein